MDRAKLTAFFLLVASLGAILLVVFLAAGPFLMVRIGQYPGGLPPGCMTAAMLVIFLPFALVPGIAGIIVWWRSVRKRTIAREREVASWPGQETTLQESYDRLVLACLDGETEASFRSLDRAAGQLSLPRRARWRRFLSMSEASGVFFLPVEPGEQSGPAAISARAARTLAFVLTLMGLFCFLWALLVVVQRMFTEGVRVLGIDPGPESAWIGASGCLIPGITLVTGGLGLVWILRKERRRQAAEQNWQRRASEILLDGCIRRIELLATHGLATSPAAAPVHKLARASIFDALEELDGQQKGRLLATLHGRRLALDLFQGSNLKDAELIEAGLSGASLSGADLSNAVLTGARLEKADLRECHFATVDLRHVAASGADLRNCNLKSARLHQGDLSHADLRNTDLRGANLWEANLTGADLRDSFVSREQLRSAASLEGASLPFEVESRR